MITRENLIAMLGFGFVAFVASGPVHAALNVFACEPEWAALASEIGGDKVSVFTATTAKQDPHQVQARPALIAQLRSADLVVCTGAELEIGWMLVLLRQAADGRVQPGSPGFFEAAQQVRLLDVPNRLDSAEGDIHLAGNPHIQTDPRNIATVAAALTRRMGELDQADAATFTARAQDFCRAMDGGDTALDAAGSTITRLDCRRLPQELGLPRGLAGLARSRDDRAQARHSSRKSIPRPTGHGSARQECAGDPLFGL
jgi:ABC-type Zn uptake system ZnuABC Zn-binding protein ZnuA